MDVSENDAEPPSDSSSRWESHGEKASGSKSRFQQLKQNVPGFIHGRLPGYTGPYSVGVMEMEVAVENPRCFSENITRNHRPLLELQTVLFDVFYPSSNEPFSNLDRIRDSREKWLPRPRAQTAKGYGKFAGVGSWAVPFFGMTTMFTRLPAYRNSPLAEHWAPGKDAVQQNVSEGQTHENTAPNGCSKPRFPLLIFSHGLGGNRTVYSSLCGELASFGFVCIAVEHRDGSAPRTIINHDLPRQNGGSYREKQPHKELSAKGTVNYDHLDYIFPKDNPFDTSPNNEKGVDKELRGGQIDLRSAEIEEAYKVMCRIVNGQGDAVAMQNRRVRGYKGSSSRGLNGICWAKWKDRVELDSVTVLGHSFGAATAINTLRNPARFPWISQGVIYDIWAAGIKEPFGDDKEGLKIRTPLLAINSEAFSYWQSNFDVVSDLTKETEDSGYPAWLMTVRGTVHINQSDFPLLYPHLTSFAMKMTINPQRALDININATLEFLTLTLPEHLSNVIRGHKNERILEMEILDPGFLIKRETYRPEQSRIATSLKIPHEFTYRLGPRHLAKRHKQRKNIREGKSGGKPATRDEIWMHIAPAQELIQSLKCRKEKRS